MIRALGVFCVVSCPLYVSMAFCEAEKWESEALAGSPSGSWRAYYAPRNPPASLRRRRPNDHPAERTARSSTSQRMGQRPCQARSHSSIALSTGTASGGFTSAGAARRASPCRAHGARQSSKPPIGRRSLARPRHLSRSAAAIPSLRCGGRGPLSWFNGFRRPRRCNPARPAAHPRTFPRILW